jgi:hypothetical protein
MLMSQLFLAQKTMKLSASQCPGGVAPQLSQFSQEEAPMDLQQLLCVPLLSILRTPQSSEVEHFFAPPPDVDQSANSHRTEVFDISS